jgi:hypothetical protein
MSAYRCPHAAPMSCPDCDGTHADELAELYGFEACLGRDEYGDPYAHQAEHNGYCLRHQILAADRMWEAA